MRLIILFLLSFRENSSTAAAFALVVLGKCIKLFFITLSVITHWDTNQCFHIICTCSSKFTRVYLFIWSGGSSLGHYGEKTHAIVKSALGFLGQYFYPSSISFFLFIFLLRWGFHAIPQFFNLFQLHRGTHIFLCFECECLNAFWTRKKVFP